MSTQLTTTNGQQQGLVSFSEAQKDVLLKSTFADLTQEEAAYAFNVCQMRGLDPFKGQVAMWKKGGKVEICVTIAGMLARAEATGEYEGMDPVLFCGKDGQWSEVWTKSDELPIAAKCTIYRKGRRPITCVAHLNERIDLNKWQHKNAPLHTLGNAPIRDCLRRGFPDVNGGLYDREEMEGYGGGSSRNIEDTTYEPVLTEQQPAQKQIAPQPSPAKPEPAKPAPKPATDEQRMVLAELMNALGQDHPDYKAVMAVIPSTSKKVLTEDAARRGIKKYQDELEARRQGEKQMAAATQPLAETEAEKAVQTIAAENAELEFDQNPY